MKNALEWSIKVFWGMIGYFALTGLCGIIGHLFFSHAVTRPDGIVMWLLASVMLFLCLALILGAYQALFGVFGNIIQPTVLLVSLIMWCVAVHGDVHLIQPYLERCFRSSRFLFGIFFPVEGLSTLLIIFVGAIGFYRALIRILPKLLFPSETIRYSAARNF
jgi:hypothetical protein